MTLNSRADSQILNLEALAKGALDVQRGRVNWALREYYRGIDVSNPRELPSPAETIAQHKKPLRNVLTSVPLCLRSLNRPRTDPLKEVFLDTGYNYRQK